MTLTPAEYLRLLRALLIEEKGKTPEEAQALLESHPVLITEALKTCSRFTMRAIAMALEMPDPKPDPFPPAVPANPKPETTS